MIFYHAMLSDPHGDLLDVRSPGAQTQLLPQVPAVLLRVIVTGDDAQLDEHGRVNKLQTA